MGRDERRQDVRIELCRPVKIWCRDTGRYLAGQTHNVSAGGALVELAHPGLLTSGQEVQVAIAWSNRSMVQRSQDMTSATVVRSLAGHGAQHLALRFAQRQELAVAG